MPFTKNVLLMMFHHNRNYLFITWHEILRNGSHSYMLSYPCYTTYVKQQWESFSTWEGAVMRGFWEELVYSEKIFKYNCFSNFQLLKRFAVKRFQLPASHYCHYKVLRCSGHVHLARLDFRFLM